MKNKRNTKEPLKEKFTGVVGTGGVTSGGVVSLVESRIEGS
jgi:hypothetical protein